MKAVIYARYSSDNQREESIEGQLRECKEYAERNGILVLQSYIDRALSAKTDNRPEFQRMIRDSVKGLFDTVLVWKLDRFARNRYDSAHYKSQLRKNGVKVVSATESIADGPEGIILESMLEGMAEYYSAELAQKVNRGMRENALKARSNGGTIPLGYRLDEEHRLKIDPLTAPVVREVFQRYADGENLRTIIRSLNERGIRTSRNYPFRHSSFNTMLKNRKYIGEYHYKDVVIPDAVPPIISKELFERVQERMKKNQHAPARAKAEEEYLLTTKLFCGHCGRLMIGESGKGRNGTIHRYYKCAGAKRRLGCHKKAVKKDWIERVAVQYTIQRVFQDDLIAQIADELVALQGAEDSALPLLRRQLADTERGIENMLNAIQQGIFTSSTRQRLEELENLRAELKSSILQAELERPQYSREDIIQWISRFKGGDPNDKAYQRQIIDIFLNSIYVFDDKLVFTYNYKKGSQTVSLDEVFAAFGSDSRAGASPKIPDASASGIFCVYRSFWARHSSSRVRAAGVSASHSSQGWAASTSRTGTPLPGTAAMPPTSPERAARRSNSTAGNTTGLPGRPCQAKRMTDCGCPAKASSSTSRLSRRQRGWSPGRKRQPSRSVISARPRRTDSLWGPPG